MEWLDGGEPVNIEGVQVLGWATQTEIAEMLGLTTRHVRDLHSRGLPVDQSGPDPRYPMPHAMRWYAGWTYFTRVERLTVAHLPFSVADRQFLAVQSRVEAMDAGTMKARPRRNR